MTTESFGSILVCLDDISVLVFVSHEHVLVFGKDHFGRFVTIVDQGVSKTESKAEHQFRQDYTEDEYCVVRHVLK